MIKALYIGAGLHLRPTKDLKSIHEFVFVDAQPRTEFSSWPEERTETYYEGFYRPHFIPDLMKKAGKYGFHLIDKIVLDSGYWWSILNVKQKMYYTMFPGEIPPDVNPTLLVFMNPITNQILKYYISVAFPHQRYEENERIFHSTLLRDMSECNFWIMCGHIPHHYLVNFVKKPFQLLAYDGTVYFQTTDDYDMTSNVIDFLTTMSDEDRDRWVSLKMRINRKSGDIEECKDWKSIEMSGND
jgi:hypothetical protein